MNTPTDCLALTLLLNQFPRNIWRDTPKMYSGKWCNILPLGFTQSRRTHVTVCYRVNKNVLFLIANVATGLCSICRILQESERHKIKLSWIMFIKTGTHDYKKTGKNVYSLIHWLAEHAWQHFSVQMIEILLNYPIEGPTYKLAANMHKYWWQLKGAQAWDIRDQVIYTERSHLGGWLEDWTKKNNLCKLLGWYSPFCFLTDDWVCSKNYSPSTEYAVKIIPRLLSMR